VLEWGPHFNDDEFTGRELEMAEKAVSSISGAIGNRDQTLKRRLRPRLWRLDARLYRHLDRDPAALAGALGPFPP